MNDTSNSNCPSCAAPIPNDAPGGLCPKCALAGAASNAATPTGRNTPPPTVEQITPHFPGLEIIELLGAGGMGAVYKARQPQLDRFVALKILSHDLSADPAFAERFNREARVLAKLSHPHIVGIFDYGTAGPHCHLIMEYVDGVNLRQAMQAGRFSPSESLAMVEDICSALKFAHEEGILHRDIKPENVLIDSKGRVKIADFGIAKLLGELDPTDVTLTMQGSVLGSPHYMAPEQIETPGDVDERADIYSVGVVFYELLTGELPLGRFALPSEKASMDARIDEIVLRTLEKERRARFQSAEEVMTQVGAVAQTPGNVSPSTKPKASDASGVARFSLASAIFTGVSLAVLFVSIIVANADAMPRKLEFLISMLILGLSGCLGIVGLILGVTALRNIRSSGGQKSGLGSSVFGIVAWPVLMMGLLSTLLLKMPVPVEPGVPRASLGPFAIILFLVVPQILGAVVLVRGLCRWARGIPASDGTKRHPGLLPTFLCLIGLVILGPVLAEVATRVFPGGERHGPAAQAQWEHEQRLAEYDRMIAENSPANQVDWSNGTPEVQIRISVATGVRARLRVLRGRENGELEVIDLGQIQAETGTQAETGNGTVKIGTTLSQSPTPNLAAILEEGYGASEFYQESGFRGWRFEDELPAQLEFSEPGRFEYLLATQGSKDEDAITMKFEVVINPLTSPLGDD